MLLLRGKRDGNRKRLLREAVLRSHFDREFQNERLLRRIRRFRELPDRRRGQFHGDEVQLRFHRKLCEKSFPDRRSDAHREIRGRLRHFRNRKRTCDARRLYRRAERLRQHGSERHDEPFTGATQRKGSVYGTFEREIRQELQRQRMERADRREQRSRKHRRFVVEKHLRR